MTPPSLKKELLGSASSEEVAFLSFYVDRGKGFATLKRGNELWERRCKWEISQAAELVPFLHDLLKEAQQDPLQIRFLAAPRGPTSFTTLRITLTVAKALAFAIPNARVFAPTQFHVLAFAVRQYISSGTDFLVLLDSAKQGFYGAIFRYIPPYRPFMVQPFAYYDRTEGDAFLRQRHNLPFVTDFAPSSLAARWLEVAGKPPLPVATSLSTEQIELYYAPRDPQDISDDTCWVPLYGHTPIYAKAALARP